MTVDVELDEIDMRDGFGSRELIERHGLRAGGRLRPGAQFRMHLVSAQRPTGVDLAGQDIVGRCDEHDLSHVDDGGEPSVECQVAPKLLDRPRGRLDGDDPAGVADEARERQRVGADVGADVEDRHAGSDEAGVSGDGAALEGAEQPDRKVDAFVEIERPADAGAVGDDLRSRPVRRGTAVTICCRLAARAILVRVVSIGWAGLCCRKSGTENRLDFDSDANRTILVA